MPVQLLTREIEVWVVVDENGEYAVGTTSEAAAEAFDGEVGFDNEVGTRRVKLTVSVPLPKPIEIRGEVLTAEEVGRLVAQ